MIPSSGGISPKRTRATARAESEMARRLYPPCYDSVKRGFPVSVMQKGRKKRGQGTYFKSDDKLAISQWTEHMCHMSVRCRGDMALTEQIAISSIESSRNWVGKIISFFVTFWELLGSIKGKKKRIYWWRDRGWTRMLLAWWSAGKHRCSRHHRNPVQAKGCWRT